MGIWDREVERQGRSQSWTQLEGPRYTEHGGRGHLRAGPQAIWVSIGTWLPVWYERSHKNGQILRPHKCRKELRLSQCHIVTLWAQMEDLGVAGSPVVVSAGVRGAYSGSIRPTTSRQAPAASWGTGPVHSQVLEHFQVPHGLQNKGKGHWEAGRSCAKDIHTCRPF